jgi:putative chitinase
MATPFQAKIQIDPAAIAAIFPKVHPKVGKEKKMNNLNGFVSTYNAYADYFGIDTALEIRHFFSQVGHECDQFNAFEEYASGTAYEGRKDLGNVYTNDGVNFKGRGALQTTGRTNYHIASEEFLKLPFITAQEKTLFANDGLVKNPKLLAEPKWATLAAFIYWNTKDLNALCKPDGEKVTIRRYDKVKKWYDYTCSTNEAITRKVNGGVNGLDERIALYNKLKNIIK